MLDAARDIFFVHIPKTGGTSIEAAHGFSPKQVQMRHQNVRSLLSETAAKPRHIFVVRRNIFDRIKSTYLHFLRTPVYMAGRSESEFTFEDYVFALRRYFEADRVILKHHRLYFKEARKTPVASLRHIQPFDWWIEGACRPIILRFETLNADYQRHVSPITGIDLSIRKNARPSSQNNIICEYTPEMVDIIERYYSKELVGTAGFEPATP